MPALGLALSDRGLTFVLHRNEEGARQALEHEAIGLAVLADCGHMHDGEQLLDVVGQHIIEETLIALLRSSIRQLFHACSFPEAMPMAEFEACQIQWVWKMLLELATAL